MSNLGSTLESEGRSSNPPGILSSARPFGQEIRGLVEETGGVGGTGGPGATVTEAKGWLLQHWQVDRMTTTDVTNSTIRFFSRLWLVRDNER